MLKRIISLLMAICITMTLFPVAVVNAAAEDSTVYTSEPRQHINPEYADLLGDSSFGQLTPHSDEGSGTLTLPQDEATYVSETKGASIIRNKFEARSKEFSFSFKTSKNIESCVNSMIDNAFTHTGVPTEGDYLNRHYGGLYYQYSYTRKSGRYYVTAKFYNIKYYTTASQEATMNTRVDNLLNQLDLWENTDYQKIKAVYDYICANVRYDYTNLNNDAYTLKYTAYAALVNKTAVCQGYASLFYRLMLELDVDARYIRGYAGGGNHGWNIVKLGNKYYNIDTTWDEGVAPAYYSWFLKSPADFTGHTRRSQYDTGSFHSAYPMSSSSYTPSTSSYLQIARQPVNTAAKAGETLKLTVSAKGEAPTYLWYIYNAASGNYESTGITASTLYTTMDSSLNGAYLACLVRDAYGNEIWTNVVQLTLAQPLKITKQPSSVRVPIGAKAKVSVSATGDGLKYQWYVKNPGSSSYKKSSVTSATYSYTMSSSKSGRKVYCIITDQYGDTVKTKTVSLAKKASPVITEQPTNKKVASGKTAKVTVVATGEGLKYQWYVKNPGSSKYSKSSITGPTYKVKMTSKISGRKVYCVITDKYGNKARTNTVVLRRSSR